MLPSLRGIASDERHLFLHLLGRGIDQGSPDFFRDQSSEALPQSVEIGLQRADLDAELSGERFEVLRPREMLLEHAELRIATEGHLLFFQSLQREIEEGDGPVPIEVRVSGIVCGRRS